MNDGLPNQMWGSVGREDRLEKTNFFVGCPVSSFKKLEGELMVQYFKLTLKVRTGARFAITQIGYDSRKATEIYQYVQSNNINAPLIGSVFILTAPAGRFFNRWVVSGVWVSDELRDIANKPAKSKARGRAFFSELAAKQIAIIKDIGYRNAYISGCPQLKRIQDILELANSFGENDWKDFAKEINFAQNDKFYYYEQDDNSDVSSNVENKKCLSSKSKSAREKARIAAPLQHRLGKFVHDRTFTGGTLDFKAGRAV